jgi:alpha-L-fucosidase
MYRQGTPEFEHHLATYGPHAQFGYKDFVPRFTAARFDADEWAQLFKDAGARYVVPVAEHHDGFALYDCAFSKWTAVKMGPQRDIIGALAAAVRRHGLTFGLSYHRAEHWWFFDGGMQFDSDVRDPRYHDFYGPAQPGPDDPGQRDWQPRPDARFLDDWLARCCELVDRYRPQLVYFDWWIEQIVFQPYLQKFAAYYYNRAAEWNAGVVINYKHDAFPEGTAVFDVERGQLQDNRPRCWQTCTTMSRHSWGYVHNQEYKTAGDIVDDLVDIVSKNGALLLNVGPRPDGTLPEAERDILLEIGRWLAVNGEAIYGTRPWRICGEGPTEVGQGEFTDTQRAAFTGQDYRFTTHGDTLYAIALDWPGEEAVITTLRTSSPIATSEIAQVDLLGWPEPLAWRQDESGLRITTPAARPGQHAYTFKITFRRVSD